MKIKIKFWSILYMCIFTMSYSHIANAAKSDVRGILPYVSDVKDQKGRNTCTIFTTVAMLETLYIQAGGSQDVDLSEEWLQYLASIANRSGGAKGSMVSTDLNNVLNSGIATEEVLPYTRGEWSGKERSAKALCGHLSNNPNDISYVRCLYGKFPSSYINTSDQALMDLPEGMRFSQARSNAGQWKPVFRRLRPRVISGNTIKQYLDKNTPLSLEINLFHGAWNTLEAAKQGMGRNAKLYKAGIVTYPENGTRDRAISPKIGSRHAVQIVGYDDDIEVEYEMVMLDGSKKRFKRRGVYIFKNSWGTNDFGRNFTYDGMRIRGFGMILQDHVHSFGKVTTFK